MIAYISSGWNTLKVFALEKCIYFIFCGIFDFYKYLSEIPHFLKTCRESQYIFRHKLLGQTLLYVY